MASDQLVDVAEEDVAPGQQAKPHLRKGGLFLGPAQVHVFQAVEDGVAFPVAALGDVVDLARLGGQAQVTAVDAQTLAVRCPSLGWRLRVPLTGPAGAAPTAAGFAAPASAPVIRRGDNVRVTIETDSFEVAYSAIATQDGRVGDTIALRGNDSKSLLSATVTGPGRARLQE